MSLILKHQIEQITSLIDQQFNYTLSKLIVDYKPYLVF